VGTNTNSGLESTQNDAHKIDEKAAKTAEFIYLGYAARILYDLLSENSVLMEMYVDDVWVKNSTNFKEPTDYEIINQNSYIRCLDYLDELIEIEDDLLSAIKSSRRINQYSQLIGTDLIPAHLLKGLTSSYCRYSGVYASVDIDKRLDKIKDRVQNLSKKSGINDGSGD